MLNAVMSSVAPQWEGPAFGYFPRTVTPGAKPLSFLSFSSESTSLSSSCTSAGSAAPTDNHSNTTSLLGLDSSSLSSSPASSSNSVKSSTVHNVLLHQHRHQHSSFLTVTENHSHTAVTTSGTKSSGAAGAVHVLPITSAYRSYSIFHHGHGSRMSSFLDGGVAAGSSKSMARKGHRTAFGKANLLQERGIGRRLVRQIHGAKGASDGVW
jgi:hypothetical protein